MVKDRLEELRSKVAVNNLDVQKNSSKYPRVPLIKFKISKRSNAETSNSDSDEFLTKECSVRKKIDDLEHLLENIKMIFSTNYVEKGELENFGKLAASIQVDLKDLEVLRGIMKGNSNQSTAYQVTQKNLYNALSKKYSSIIIEYQQFTDIQREKMKALLKSEMRICGYECADEDLKSMLDNEELSVFTDNYTVKHAEERRKLLEAEQTLETFHALENSIVELNQLFTEVAFMVGQQEEKIDIIDWRVNKIEEQVNDGAETLHKTKETKNRRRKLKVICIIVAVLLLAIIITLIIFT